jgi:hypothetical protein
LFFKPKEKAGEVWAILQTNAEAWLKGDRNDMHQPTPANVDQRDAPEAPSKYGMTG